MSQDSTPLRDDADFVSRLHRVADEAKAADVKPVSALLDEAKQDPPPLSDSPISCLGRDTGGRLVLWSREGRNTLARDPERITWATLTYCAAEPDVVRWLTPHLATNKPTTSDYVAAARNLLYDECRRRGEYDPSKTRGRGVWADGTGWTYNTGAECYHVTEDSTITPTEAITPHMIYLSRTAAERPADEPMSDADAAAVLQSLRARPWAAEGSGDMIAGWIVAATISGALSGIHPHVWITAPAGTGKTTLCDDMQRLTPCNLHMCGANTTEAAIRQKMQADAVPLMIDEAEATDDGDRNRDNIARWLELLRTASYGGTQIKGSGDGVPREYPLRFCACLLSIADILSRDADLSRVLRLKLNLLPPAAMRAIWAGQQAGAAILAAEDCPARFLRRVLLSLPALRRNREAMIARLQQAYPQATDRRCDMIATLLAAANVYTSTGDMTAAQLAAATRLAAPHMDATTGTATDDATACLERLLSRSLRLGGTPMTVHSLCHIIANVTTDTTDQADAATNALATLGMRWERNEGLIVNSSKANMREIYSGHNQWAAGTAAQYLSRLPNINTARRRINGSACDCLVIPQDLILKS